MAIKLSTSVKNSRLNAIKSARDAGAAGGKIKIFTGPRPTSGGAPTTLLAELTFQNISSPDATNGKLTASAINTDPSSNASGIAVWFREEDSDGNFILDGDVGTSGSDLNLNTTSIVVNNPVSISSYIITEGN